jgi:putative transposase
MTNEQLTATLAERALDSTGQTIDFLLTAKRDMAAAKRFLGRATTHRAMPCRG